MSRLGPFLLLDVIRLFEEFVALSDIVMFLVVRRKGFISDLPEVKAHVYCKGNKFLCPPFSVKVRGNGAEFISF